MDFWEIIGSWYFIGGMVAILVILVVVFFILRSRGQGGD